jgi:hypothetical protein
MIYTLMIEPNTRINDCFVQTDKINCEYPKQSVINSLIPQTIDDVTRYYADFYNKIALDIVTETVFDYPYPCITEKTLRPIACKRMFAIVGPAHTLTTLKDYGFKTWNDIIDESYDQILDPEARFLSIINSIDNFCKMSLSDVRSFLHDNQDRLEHNFQVLQSLRVNEIKKLKEKLKGY